MHHVEKQLFKNPRLPKGKINFWNKSERLAFTLYLSEGECRLVWQITSPVTNIKVGIFCLMCNGLGVLDINKSCNDTKTHKTTTC